MMDDQNNNAVTVAGEHQQSGTFLAAILEAATNPDVDPAKVEAMANLAVSLQDRERQTKFNRDKFAAIMEMPTVTKDGRIIVTNRDTGATRQQGRFARFEDIDAVVRPILMRHNLALSFDVAERAGGGLTVRPILTHANGFTERGEAMPLPADASGGKNAVQAMGSSVQYGKRYTACAMLNIVTEAEDDDGSGQPVSLPYEREQQVLADARAAFDAGGEAGYQQWFSDRASPKDRAWLLKSGHHVEFGGQAQLPSQRSSSERAPPPQQQKREREQAKSDGQSATREQRAREWTDWFKHEATLLPDAAAVEAFKDEHEATLATLEKGFPAMHKEATRAVDDKLASF